MVGLRLRRHTTSIQRCGDDTGPTQQDVHLEIDLPGPDVCARLDGGSTSATADLESATLDLENAAELLRAGVLAVVPRCRRTDVVVESGRVTDRLIEREHVLWVQERTFLLATCGGTLLELTDGLVPSQVTGIPAELATTHLAPDDSVVLSPSAVLSLIEHCTEGGDENWRPNLPVSILQRAWSPYPPHDVPNSLILKEQSGDSGGAACMHRSPRIDARFYLSIRPDWWSQPFGAIAGRLGSIEVSCKVTSAMPPRALLIDAITSLSNATGRAECEAEFSILSEGRGNAMCERPVRLLLDAGKVMGSVVSAIGSARPARSSDPIMGDRFGIAPALLTTIRSGQLMESVQ